MGDGSISPIHFTAPSTRNSIPRESTVGWSSSTPSRRAALLSIRNFLSTGQRGSARIRFVWRLATVLQIPIAIRDGVGRVSLPPLPDNLWLWLAIAGLGLFHGINPAMGWLFAVALGLNRRNERVVWLALLPIGLGHAIAVAVILFLVLAIGLVLEPGLLRPLAAAVLFAWAGWHALYGRRHKVRFGMQVGLGGLFLWSFLMANAHGAGLMLIPAVIPLCLAASPTHALTLGSSVAVGLAALSVHTAAMLATIGFVSIAVYKWIGVGFLRRGWINLDLLWTVALVICGIIVLVV